MEMDGRTPSRAATSSVSFIIVVTSSLVERLRQIWAMVERDSALSGLKVMLPISFTQMSSRRSGSTGHFSPPARIASLKARQRGETLPSGSPMENRVPSMCWMTPGAAISVAA